MIRIGKRKPAQRLELGAGAWIEYRPMTTVDREAGLVAARKFAKAVREGAAALSDYGVDIGDVGALSDDESLAYGVGSVVSMTEIGLRCISAWGGFADEDGVELPLNRASLSALLHDTVYYEAISSAIGQPIVTLDAEGNVSAPSPSGASVGAENTAEVAAI